MSVGVGSGGVANGSAKVGGFTNGSVSDGVKTSTLVGSTSALTNVEAQSDAWGKFIPMTWGFVRVGGALIWGSPYYKNIDEFRNSTQYTATSYQSGVVVGTEIIENGVSNTEVTTYFIDLAYSIGFEGDTRTTRRMKRVRVNGVAVYDAETSYIAPGIGFSIRQGGSASIDPVMAKYPDTGIYWYPGQTYIIFDRFPLANYGGALPQSVDIEFYLDEVGEDGITEVFPTHAGDRYNRSAFWIGQKVRKMYHYLSDVGDNGTLFVYDLDSGERLDDVPLIGDGAAQFHSIGHTTVALGESASGRDAEIGMIATQDVNGYFAIDLVNGYVIPVATGTMLNLQYLDGDGTFAKFIGANFDNNSAFRVLRISRVSGGLVSEFSSLAGPFSRAGDTVYSTDEAGNFTVALGQLAYVYLDGEFRSIPVETMADGDSIVDVLCYEGDAILLTNRNGTQWLERYTPFARTYITPAVNLAFKNGGGINNRVERHGTNDTGVWGNVGNSFFVIADLRSGQVRRYEYGVAGNGVWDSTSRQFVYWDDTAGSAHSFQYGPNSNGQGISLFSFMQSLMAFSGKYQLSQIINDGIDDLVLGAFINEQVDVNALLADICTAYRIERQDTADTVTFYRNRNLDGGLTIAATIPIDELVVDSSAGGALVSSRKSTSTTPSAVTLKFIDPDNEFKTNTVTYTRPDAVDTSTTANVNLPFVMTVQSANELAQAAVSASRELVETHTFKLPPKYAYLEKSDIVRIVGNTFITNIRITQNDLGGDFTTSCEGETVAIKLNITPSKPILPPRATTSTTTLATVAYLFDTPTLAIEDDTGDDSFVQYDVLAPAKAGMWDGAYLARIPETGDPSTLFHVYGPSTCAIFKASNALGNLRWQTDPMALTGVLSGTYLPARNSTKAQIDADGKRNIAWYGADGRWEIIQFQSIINGVMSGIVRGLRGTEIYCGRHVIGDLVIIPEFGIAIEHRPVADIGHPETYKAVTDGSSYSTTSATPARTPTGASLRPFAPSRVKAVRDAGSGDVQISWNRRDRKGSGWGHPLPVSDDHGFQVEVVSGAVVVRTIAAGASPAVYAAADQATDGTASAAVLKLRVAQIGALGPGFTETRDINVG